MILFFNYFYLMIFIEQNLIYFKSLNDNYEVKINYYIIPQIFFNKAWASLTYCIYYKIFIPIIFPDL